MELERTETQEEPIASLKHDGYVKLTAALIWSAIRESENPTRFLKQSKGGKKIKVKEIEIFLERLKNWALKDEIFIPAFSVYYQINEEHIRRKIVENCIETLQREKRKEHFKVLTLIKETVV